MREKITRRGFLAGVPALSLVSAVVLADEGERVAEAPASFPSQDPELVLEIVRVSHFSLERVEGLLSARPELSKAAWDWGFGDWETALGAASHTGNREIALLLLERGARMDVFAAAMLGHTGIVRAFVEASPGIQRTPGPHGITLLAHARAGGEPARGTVEYLRGVEGADDGVLSVPLSAAERRVYEGDYESESGIALTVRSWTDRSGKEHLVIERPETDFRGLTHLGGHSFAPWGAPHVRLDFGTVPGGPVATRLSVLAPAPILVAYRVC